MPDDIKNEDVNDEEVVDNEEGTEEEVDGNTKEDRPEANYKAELARKNKELETARAELAKRDSQPQKRDQNDITTWSDHELKAIIKSNDPSIASYKDQAEDLLLDRKVRAIRAREMANEKRAVSDLKLRKEYPEAMDPSSDFSVRMEEVMQEYDLDKTPSGRLAAAKLVASESKGKSRKSSEADRESESSRVRDVKSQMLDGDRPKSGAGDKNPKKKIEDAVSKLNSHSLADQTAGMSDLLKAKGLKADTFFKR